MRRLEGSAGASGANQRGGTVSRLQEEKKGKRGAEEVLGDQKTAPRGKRGKGANK